MKKIFLFILAVMLASSVDAQVSVRRTSRKNAETKTEARPKAPTALPANPEGTEIVKRTTPAKTTPAAAKRATTRVQPVSGVDNNSVRRQLFDEYQRRAETSDSRWQHVVYREIDVLNDANAALYYPQEPTDGMTNFFRVVFDAVISGKVTAYEYLDGREVFAERYKLNVQDMLDKQEIFYSVTTDRDGRSSFKVDEVDVPSEQITTYYIKERWELDKTTSQIGPRVLAICPVLRKTGEIGELVRYPLFWVSYEDIKPLLVSQPIMVSGINNATRYSMDDFFRLSLYEGQLYKVQNPRGLTLMQQYPDPDTLAVKRAQLEAQLQSLSKQLAGAEDEETPSAEKTQSSTKSGSAKEKQNRRTKESVPVKAPAGPKSHTVRR